MTGKVMLVGAGPGAADLLTLRALKALQGADVVLYDALITGDVLDLIPTTTRKIAVGKRGHGESTPQDFTNALMARLARAGQCVVRLKGGDPSVFGRAGEERAYLEERNIVVEVIPGITTASAAAAQFGFSLTSRGDGRRVMLATGHTIAGTATGWAIARDPETTLCLYMAHGSIASIATQLLEAGRSPDTPTLVATGVERPDMTGKVTTLAGLLELSQAVQISAPVFIAIGQAISQARAKRSPLVSDTDADPSKQMALAQ